MSLAPQSNQSLLVSTEVKDNAPFGLAHSIASRSLLFIDSGVAGAEAWMKQPGAYLLDSGRDAIEQITEVLAGRKDVASVQIVSHGRSGGLLLGQDWLDAAALQNRASEIRLWQNALTKDADILLFGCEVAAGSLGRSFVQVLADLSGADVAASDDLTGSQALGGDWDLEVQTGAIGSVALFQSEQADYEGVLNTTYHSLATDDFFQNWNSPTTIINSDGDWASVPSIVGYGGGGLAATAGINPQTVLADGSTGATVLANQTTIPSDVLVPGGIMEFNGFSNKTIALKGSDAVTAPHLVLYMDATGQQNVRVSFVAKDIDNTATSNAITPIAVQYRLGNTGDFINLPDGAITDITAQSTDDSFIRSARLTVLLPKEVSNQANLQIRILTTNAVGVDEWVGIDDIKVTSTTLASNNTPLAQADLYKVTVGGSLKTSPSVTGLDFDSNLGNFVGQRETARYRTYDTSFVENVHYGNSVRFITTRLGVSNDNWDVTAYPPTGTFLVPGNTYNNAARFASTTAPGFTFTGSGRGYNTSLGNFTVNQLLYGANNEVASWDVSFTDYRGDGETLAKSMSGRLRYNATADGNLPGVLSNDSDGEGSALTASLVTGPQSGTLAFNADGSFTYTPNAGFEGFDTFTYTASDSIANSTPTTVRLQVGTPGTVSITATDVTATEAPGNTGNYRISRTGNLSLPLEINLSVDSGSTAAPTDYSLSGGNLTQVGSSLKVTIPAGQSFVDLTLTAIDDIVAEGLESVRLKVEDGLYFTSSTNPTATVGINPEDFAVTNTNAAGEGSLVQAISNANTIAGTDTITFSGAIFTDATPDIITPANTLSASSDFNIIAPEGLTISGGTFRQVFNIGSGRTVTLQNLTIADGSSVSGGGGISNSGTLTLRNVTVRNNLANGTSSDGGGISNRTAASLTIENSTIENNTSGDDGGGISNSGILTILNSTISDNTANSASSTTSGGGGLLNTLSGTATITNSTISGNTALNGGGIRNDGTLTLINDTITKNTASGAVGGLLNSFDTTTFSPIGRTTIKNTIIAGNIDSTPTPLNIIDLVGGINSFTDQGNNLLGAAETSNSPFSLTTLKGTTAAPIDPKLDVLANNGGKTKTHALQVGSSAIDAGTATGAPGSDQRGASRIGVTDIGAFERDGVVNAAPTAIALQNVVDILDGQSTIVPTRVADIVITDDGVGTNIVTISGPDAARFTVSGGRLSLVPGGTIDFETKSQYNITLSVDDPTVGTSPDLTQNFVFNVVDVNEAPTAIALTNTVTQLPDSTNATTGVKVADIVITDDALGTETFTLTGADSGSFEVRQVAGLPVLFFKAPSLNPVTKPTYNVTVNAQDQDIAFSPILSRNFSLNILDVNDPPTNLVLQNPITTIAENTSTTAAIEVATITFTDDTTGTNTIAISGADAGAFELSGNKLLLKAGTVLDFETKPSYAVTITVDDATLGTTAELTQNFVLTVTNVNEAPTALALTNPVTTLLETANTAGGVKVADIAITDDALGDETITVTGTDAASFEIRDVAGGKELFFIGTGLNAITKPSYSVSVSAIDATIIGSTALTQPFTLSITDVNTPPTGLLLQNAVNAIDENTSTAADVPIADIVFTDDGTGTNTIALSGADAAKFKLVGNALFLRAGTVLDFETQSSYAITITVDDASLGTTPELTQNFALTVRNVNEAPTALALTNPVTTLSATTNTAGGIKVADITITDDALGDETVTLTGTDAASFEIRDVAGAKALFFIATTLNAVTKPSYSVSVSAIDPTIVGSTALTQPFTLAITSVNAAPTALTFQNAVTTIAENTSTTVDVKVADLVITDEGLGTNTIAIGGTDAAQFAVVGNALFLKAGTVLDFETKPNYDITITVDDTTVGATPDLTQAFSLTVTNVNEAPTALALTNPVTTLSATTNTTGGIKVADITITDDALGDETVTVTGADAASFEIRDVAGAKALFLIAPTLNAVTKPSYSVSVSAIDSTIVGSTALTQPFTLTITGVNQAPTALTLTNPVTTIAENTSTTAAVKVADLVITDEGLGTNTIAIGGADAARFTLVGNELFLRAGTVLDFETKPNYDITITVDDTTVGATPDLTQAFSLAVTNVNEAPTALALTNPLTSINETTNTAAGVKIADIAVTDDALGDETFTLAGADAASFAIRDVAGAKALFFIGTGLNAATKPTYAVTVQAEDVTLLPSTKVSAGLTLTITGNNAAPTALALNNRVTAIAENSSTTVRTKVADLAITDDGLGTNTLSIGGTDAASFEISGNALYLKAGTALNFETKPSYSITVNVDDTTVGLTPDLTQAFSLNVTDINEAPTALAFTPATLTLAENTPTNIKVADIALTDDALGTERFFLSGSDAASFEVRSVAGTPALFFTGNLDFESKPNYSVTVEAIDDTLIGSNPISKTFTLSVTNQDDPTVGTVTINGNPAPGNTLTSSNTLFDQDVIRVYTYQWQSSTDGINFTDITIANSASFSVTPNEAGKRLRLKLTTTDGLQNATSTFSAPTGVISNTPVPPIPPIPNPNPNPTPIPAPAALSVISTVSTQTIAQWLPNLTTANYPSGSSYVITSDRPDLFETPPTIAPNGTLTYGIKPGLEVNQTINLTIQVRQPDGTINPATTVRSTLNLRFRAEALVRNTRTEELGLLYIDQVNQIQGAKPITLGSNFGAQAGKSVPLNAQWQIIDTKDFNRDGIADILFQNRALDETAIWMMNSNGQIMDAKWLTGGDGQRLRTQNAGWKAVGFADIDGDRNLDIVWHNQQTDEIGFWFLQTDGFTVKSYDYLRDSSGAILKTKNPAWQLSKLGDFDGDGDMDLLFRLPELNQTAVIRLQGKTFVDAQFLGTSPDSSLIIRGVGDYNSDRIADIYWQTPQNDRVVVQPLKFQSGRWVSESFITIASGGNRPLQGIADLDRNSTDDLLFLDPATNGLLAKPVEQTNNNPTAIQQQGRTFTFSGTDWSIVQTDEFGDLV